MKNLDHIRCKISDLLPKPHLLFHFGDEVRFNNEMLIKNSVPEDEVLLQYYPQKLVAPGNVYLDHSYEPIYTFERLWSDPWVHRKYHDNHEKIVIHSERSDDIQKLNQMDFNTVYWFANGYLCSEYWYRFYDVKIVEELSEQPVHYPWVCLNRLIDFNRAYRIYFLDIIDCNKGFYTLPDRSPDTNRTVREIIPSSKVEPSSYDNAKNSSAWIDVFESTPINRSFLHVVPETMFSEKKHHLTEKIFRPIVLMQPFVLLSSPGSLEYLRSYGFKTFNEFWDESYDDIQNDTERLHAAAKIVDQIGNLTLKECDDLRQKMKPIIEHNRNWFYNGFSEVVWNELKKNLGSVV